MEWQKVCGGKMGTWWKKRGAGVEIGDEVERGEIFFFSRHFPHAQILNFDTGLFYEGSCGVEFLPSSP